MTAPPIIGVHLDLKGMNFKPAYLPQYLADLAGQKINTVLIEYEDVFPFQGVSLAADPARMWSHATLQTFLQSAQRHHIEVIPLQQCLGHLEYLLGWKQFRPLAEDRHYPSTLRVDDRRARALITNLLGQICAAHPASRYVHVGMDEAHALRRTAQRLKKDVLDVFLDHLRLLIPVVEAAGKMPMVWTDMLEDHFRPDAFREFRDRVIFATWDYSPCNGLTPVSRFYGGARVSRTWLAEPAHPAAPAIGPGTKFTEDYPPAIARVVAPYRRGRLYVPFFQLDLWTRLGVRAVTASAVRVSANLSVLPPYNALLSNIQAAGAAVRRTKQAGQIGTSWARGTTWGPPNFCIDLQWPLVTAVARSLGAKPKPFWPGLPTKTTARIIQSLGRCRDHWSCELQLADEMDQLAPRLRAHRYEWDGIALMARVLGLQRRADYNVLEVDYFHANNRPCDTEWQRRIVEQNQTLRAIAKLRRRVRAHFCQRYAGSAFEEWLRHLFDLHEQRIRAGQKICRVKLQRARRVYQRKVG